MSRHAHVNADGIVVTLFGGWSRRLLAVVMLVSGAAAHAAQPLSDHDLKQRYLAYSAEENQVVVVRQTVLASRIPQTLSSTLRLVDRENTDNLLRWQDQQSLAVGANLGLQDTSRQVLAAQPIASFGSEPFSSRWAGNLDQIIEVSRISGFSLYGVDVELYNISGGVRIQSQTF
jgi:hypothetical protein